MPTRRRLDPEDRRAELLDIGTRLFEERSFDGTTMDDVAAQAQVSRALVYHYYPTKAALFAAIWKRAHDQLATASTLGSPATIRDGVADALSQHLDFYRDHPTLVFIANRSAIAADPAVREPVRTDLTAIRDRILDAGGITGHPRQVAAAALSGWIAFVRELAIEWLVHGTISREETEALCLAALDATAGAHLDLDAAPLRQ